MDFPPQSPDLLPTDCICRHLKTEKAKHPVTPGEAFWDIVTSFWDNVGNQIFHQLVGLMAIRALAVIKMNSKNTKYTLRYSERNRFRLIVKLKLASVMKKNGITFETRIAPWGVDTSAKGHQPP